MHPFRKAVEAGDLTAIEGVADDVACSPAPSPSSRTPGKAITAAILRGVSRVFTDFRYVREIAGADGRDHALLFTAKVGEFQGAQRLRLPALRRGRQDRRPDGDGPPALGGPGALRGDGCPVRADLTRGGGGDGRLGTVRSFQLVRGQSVLARGQFVGLAVLPDLVDRQLSGRRGCSSGRGGGGCCCRCSGSTTTPTSTATSTTPTAGRAAR